MKTIFRLLGLSVILLTVPIYAQDPLPAPVQPHFYGLPNATIQYVLSGAAKGTENLYFDQWGMRQVRYRAAETPRYGVMTIMTLNLAEQIIIVDPSKHLGQKKIDANVKTLLANFKPEDQQLISDQLLTNMGAVKGATENFLDRPCDIWENKKTDTKFWVWKGIALKTEMKTPDGPVSITATAIDESTPVDENAFTIPENVRFIDTDINQILISLRIDQ